MEQNQATVSKVNNKTGDVTVTLQDGVEHCMPAAITAPEGVKAGDELTLVRRTEAGKPGPWRAEGRAVADRPEPKAAKAKGKGKGEDEGEGDEKPPA